MFSSKDNRIISTLERNFFKYFILLVVFISIFITLQFPVFFRLDDATFLYWSRLHSNPLDSFQNSKASLFGTFRPMQNLIWWVMYRVFGLNSFLYQLFTTLLYGLSFVFLFKFVEKAFTRKIAILTVILYFMLFLKLTYIIFWFSDLTFILEIFLINLSLYFLITAINKHSKNYVWGILCYIFASLSKEPAIIIIPVASLYYVIAQWKVINNRIKSLIITGSLLIVGVIWTFFNPSIKQRAVSTNILSISSFLKIATEKFNFYSGHLFSGLGILILFFAFYILLKQFIIPKRLKNGLRILLSATISIAISLVLIQFPVIALIALFLSFIPFVILRHREAIGAIWFTICLIGLIGIRYNVQAYLLEASLGLTIFLAYAVSIFLSDISQLYSRTSIAIKRIVVVLCIILLCFALVAFSRIAYNKYKILQITTNTRQNFKDVFTFIIDNITEEEIRIVSIEWEDMGTKEKYIVKLPDNQKASIRKTMRAEDIRRFLYVMNRQDIKIYDFQDFSQNKSKGNYYIWVLSNIENDFLIKQNLNLTPIFSAKRGNEESILYRIKES